MDAGLSDVERVPVFRTPERARRWCWLRTLHDMRLAERRGRPISRPNARRLIQRRWSQTAQNEEEK